MTRCHLLLCCSLVAFGCTKPVPPVFEEPVPFSSPSGPGALGQRLTVGADNLVLLSWIERREGGGTLRVASLQDNAWSLPKEVVNDPRMFVNWADFPSVTSMSEDNWVAHWLSKSADLTYSYDVALAQSADAGDSWSPTVIPHTDATPTEHGFVSVWPAAGGTGLVWLDGRKTVNGPGADPAARGMTLRAATIDTAGKLSGEQEIDGLICDCCQTDVAISSAGPIAVYRDRTAEEIRDISITRYVDGRWQAPQSFSNDGWEIGACPVNGPAIAAHADLVAVAWFTAARDSPIVKVRVSKNAGKDFGEAIVLATGSLLGHVDITYIGDSSFAVSWLTRGNELHDILIRSVTSEGDVSLYKTAGRTSVTHNVPQMIEHDGKLIMAWTDLIKDESRIATTSLEIVHAR